ncbi:MAG: AMP-dependent synthetase and ligase [Rhodocyclaceae bacterium]|nr:MAG: AMP-dependent synthetase and ligase [Rhodocyclaceae bacterium]TND03802.1 MAG: AMP-dependent synthetase and ligase [Rhodocyclaceae bacterium]
MAPNSELDQAAQLLSIVDRLVAEVRPAGRSKAGLDSSLERDLGLDSLARVELLARIEQAFSVRLSDEVLGSAETSRDLLAALAAGATPVEGASAGTPWQAPEPVGEGSPDSAVTLVEVLQWHARRHPQRPHVLFQRSATETDTLDYGQLLATARQVAAGLRRIGIVPGQCVALMLPTGLEFFHSFYGILLAGAVPVPIYPPTRPGQIEDHLCRQAGILQNCEAAALISFDAARLVARILSGLVPSLREVTTPDELRASGKSAAPADDHRGHADDVALLQYTSGSTGNPKGVTLDHGNLLANIRAWGQAVEWSASDVVVSWLPLYHDMGLIGAWLGSLYHASPLVLMSPLDFLARPERWLWAIHQHRGTLTAAPNFAFELCLRHLDPARLQGLDLSSWRYAANGAEPVAAETLARFAAAFHPYGFRAAALAPVYGLAECSVGLAVSPPGRGPLIDRVQREPLASGEAVPAAIDDIHVLSMVACGRPLPGHEVRIVDEAGVELPPRRVGRLEFRGPSATRGYYRNAEASAKLIRDGWLDSGDLAYLAEGDIVITGRIKDTIIRGGRNLYPYELEEAVGAIPGVRRGCVAVFGVAAAGQGTEKLVVVAESRETGAAARQELIRRVNGLTVDLLGTPPDDVVLAPPHAVLKTSSGKIRRSATRDVYCGEGFDAGGRALWLQVVRLSLAGFWQACVAALRRGVELLYGGYAWCVYGLLLLPAVAGILLLPGIERRWRFVGAIARTCVRLCGIRLQVEGLAHAHSGSGVFVANHASYVDSIVLAAALPMPVTFVAKQELAAHPFAGPLLRHLGAVFVERFDARQGVDDVRRLAQGDATRPLFFFAEGTFTRQPGLRPFRLGAFQIAVQNGLAVTPVVLAGTREILRDESMLPRRGAVRVTVCAPIAVAGEGWQAALRLRDAARREILKHCGEPDMERSVP